MLGYAAALAAAVAYGLSTLLEASAARRSTASTGLDPRLVGRLLHQWMFVAGVLASIAGVLASVVALRRLPLFVVQAIVSA